MGAPSFCIASEHKTRDTHDQVATGGTYDVADVTPSRICCRAGGCDKVYFFTHMNAGQVPLRWEAKRRCRMLETLECHSPSINIWIGLEPERASSQERRKASKALVGRWLPRASAPASVSAPGAWLGGQTVSTARPSRAKLSSTCAPGARAGHCRGRASERLRGAAAGSGPAAPAPRSQPKHPADAQRCAMVRATDMPETRPYAHSMSVNMSSPDSAL